MKATEPVELERGRMRGAGTIQSVQAVALAALTALAIFLCWKLVAPFVNAFAWAFTLTIVCAPLRKWLLRRLPRVPATVLIMALTVVVIALPLTLVLRELLRETAKAQSFLLSSIQANDLRSALGANRWLGPLWVWADQQLDLSAISQQIAGEFASWIAPAVAHSVSVISQTGVMLLAFFFFLRDEEVILNAMGSMVPLSPAQTERVFARVASTIRTAVYGRVFIGFVQGFLGGVIFAIVGLPAAIFWGAVMSVLATLPFLGAFVVWIPAAIYLLLTGHWISAVVVGIWGIAIIHPVDNILYPVLVGSRVGMHPLILFVAFVGGLIAFGPTGLILGPCIVAFTVGLIEAWQEPAAGATEGGV